jgi:hypothetical protein
MQARSWLDDEASISDGFRQAGRLFIGGLRRPILTLGLTLAVAALVGALLLVPRHGYAPKLLLRVIEADRDPTSMPQPRRKLREYVRQALLTSDRLVPLIERYRLYPSLARRNMRAALDSFREDIDVDVYQNYFVEERAVGSEPRSARVAVSYRAKDPETAVAVTRELGSVIIERERAMRTAESDRAEGMAALELAGLRAAIADKSMAIAKMQAAMQAETDPAPTRQVELVGLLGSLTALERRETEVSRREATLSLGAALERHGIGLSFEIADDAGLPSGAHHRDLAFFGVGASVVFGLPLIAMAVGSLGAKRGKA